MVQTITAIAWFLLVLGALSFCLFTAEHLRRLRSARDRQANYDRS